MIHDYWEDSTPDWVLKEILEALLGKGKKK